MMIAMRWAWAVGVASLIGAACGGASETPAAPGPAPEVDDLDVDREPGRAFRPARLIDRARLEHVLANVPYHGRYRGVVKGRLRVEVTGSFRAARDGEPGGFVSEGSFISSGPPRARIDSVDYYAADPPYRLLAAVEIQRVEGREVRRFDVRNQAGALWLQVTENGVAGDPIRRPPSRATLAAGMVPYMLPEDLSIGASQTFRDLDIETGLDRRERLTVRDKGTAIVDGRRLPTVVFESESGGKTGTIVAAGGETVLRFEARDFVFVRVAPR